MARAIGMTMARARNIKPGLYKNEDLAECSLWARYLFPGLWTLADREGRLEDRPKRIKGELLPFDAQDVEPPLCELAARGFIVRYQIDAKAYIQISKFKEHQSPHYSEKHSVIKPPPLPENGGHIESLNSGKDPAIKEGSQPPDSLIPDSLIVGVPRKRGTRSSRKQTTPLPEPFVISERVRKWAAGKSIDRLDEHLESFVMKCHAKGYTYVDWDAAFMGAINADWAKLRANGTPNKRAADTTCSETLATRERCGMPATERGGGVFRCDHCQRKREERSHAPMPASARKALDALKIKRAAA